jgi:copper chaperone
MTDATTALNDLGLTAKATDLAAEGANSGGCGGGCNCTCGANDADTAVGETASATAASEGPVTAEFGVLGMTCAHCVSSVSEEVFDIEGVQNVAIVLNVGGASTVTVTSAARLDPAAIDAAVTEAGYELASASA